MVEEPGLLRAEPEPGRTTQGGRLGLETGKPPQALVGNVTQATQTVALGAGRN